MLTRIDEVNIPYQGYQAIVHNIRIFEVYCVLSKINDELNEYIFNIIAGK